MTLVVTTASARGITVVGDRAVTRQSDAGVEILEARKVWYSPKANLALAFRGNANLPGSESLEDWAQRFVDKIKTNDAVATVSELLVSTLNPQLESLGKPRSYLRRGIHVSGYENGLPVIVHVHTGDLRAFHHALELHRDYPDIHGGGLEPYRLTPRSSGAPVYGAAGCPRRAAPRRPLNAHVQRHFTSGRTLEYSFHYEDCYRKGCRRQSRGRRGVLG